MVFSQYKGGMLMNNFLLSLRPIHVSDYMGVDYFDSCDMGCTFVAACITAAEETKTGTRFSSQQKTDVAPKKRLIINL